MPSFSQRIGKTSSDEYLQVDSADEGLRVGIWNAIWKTVIDDAWAKPKPTLRDEVLDDIWEHFFRKPTDETPKETHTILADIKDWMVKAEWYELYDLLEFVYSVLPPTEVTAFEASANRALESQRSAYRMMNGAILPVSDAVEVAEVTRASERLKERGIGPARDHLANAIQELGKRRRPDFDLAVREAAAAVQSVSRWAARRDVASLMDAFRDLDPGGLIPTTLKQGLASIFDTEGAQGSGHPFQLARGEVGLPEARFTIVSASALINYLLALAGPDRLNEAEIKPDGNQIGGSTDAPKALPEL